MEEIILKIISDLVDLYFALPDESKQKIVKVVETVLAHVCVEDNNKNIDDNNNNNQKIEKESRKKKRERQTHQQPPLGASPQPSPEGEGEASPQPSPEGEGAAIPPEPLSSHSFISYFNSKMANSGALIPKMSSCCGKRSKSLKARCREYGKEAVKTMVDKAAVSDFLNGHNNMSWTATIDWLLRPNNFVKVIEGNYDNNSKTKNYGTYNQQQNADRRRGTYNVEHSVEEYEQEV